MRALLKTGRDERIVRRGDRVLKISSRPADLENQYLWLRHFAGLPCVPRVWSFARHGRFGVLTLEFVDGMPLHHELARNPDTALPLVRSLVDALGALRARPVDEMTMLTRDDLRRHYVRRVTRRFATALTWVPCLAAERFAVNGRTVRNPYTLVSERSEQILDLVAADAEAGPVHGDPNLSNVICHPTGDAVRLVDPGAAFAERRALAGDLSDDAAHVSYCMNGFCDIIENHGALHRSDSRGFEVELEVTPVFGVIGPRVVDLLTSAFPVSERGLMVREALLYLTAVPQHVPDAFQVHALLARGVDRLSDAGIF